MTLLLRREQDRTESVPKYCPLWGQALAPGNLSSHWLPRVCLSPSNHSLSVSSAGCEPLGAWTLPSAGQSVLSHVPLAEGREEGPPELVALLQRQLTDTASRSWSGSRLGLAPARWGAAPDNNSPVSPPARSQLGTLWNGCFLPFLSGLPPQTSSSPMFPGSLQILGQESISFRALTIPGSSRQRGLLEIMPGAPGTRARPRPLQSWQVV